MQILSSKKENLGLQLSRGISNVFNPLTSLTLYSIYYSFRNFTIKEAFFDLGIVLLVIVLPVVVWIQWNVRRGVYSNMDVSNRQQRNSLYVFVVLVMMLYMGIRYFIQGFVDYKILFLFVLLLLMQMSNFLIKSSMHTGLNIYTAVLFYSQDKTLGIIWLIIAFLVGITRVILKRHTVKEVLMGAFLAFLVSAMYLYVYVD